jgi:hypothetical protein
LGANEGDDGLGRRSESISDAVFGTGSLSALIVLKTLGNAARVDPVEGSGAPLYRIVLEKHGGGFETRERVNETGTDSHAGEKQSGDGVHLTEP